MGKFNLDFSYLRKNVISDNNRVPLRGNEDKITRVAFDMFRMDNEPETLWKVQSDDDGNEFLVRTYSLPEDKMTIESSWTVDTDTKKANLTIFYKGVPVHRIKASNYGANTPEESEQLATVVRRKLASSKEFADKLLKTIPKLKLKALAVSFPELISNAEEYTRHTRPTVEVPIVNRPEIQQEREYYNRQRRETSEHIPVKPLEEEENSVNLEEKMKQFISSTSFNQAFERWLEENK